MKKVHFPGLNGVRFIAALLVIVDHTELFKSNLGYETIWGNSYSSYLGASGVTIFFVLSGFLITYLLLSEKENGAINIRNFYVRRILRIWPLYYLILMIGFFIAPHIELLYVPNYSTDMSHYGGRLALFAGLLANAASVYLPTVAFANILWTVSVEEQFYLMWPHFIKRSRNILRMLSIALLAYLIIKLGATVLFPKSQINALIYITRFSAMIIGAAGAYLVYMDHKLLKVIYNRKVQIGMILLFIIMISNEFTLKYWSLFGNEILSVMVIFLIINIATNKYTIIKLQSRSWNYLGKISYGLYVYHLFAVVVVLKCLPGLIGVSNLSGLVGYSVIMGCILFLTILISHISYTYFESPILRMKLKFTSIISGDLVERKEERR